MPPPSPAAVTEPSSTSAAASSEGGRRARHVQHLGFSSISPAFLLQRVGLDLFIVVKTFVRNAQYTVN